MGNYQFGAKPLKPGSIVTVHDDKFSRDQEIPADLLRRGQQVKVLKTRDLYQSRPGRTISVTTVQHRSGEIEAYPTINLG